MPHLHMFELGDITIPTTADDGGPGHTHKTILPDGTVVELGEGTPDGPDGTPHVHMVDIRGSMVGTSDAISALDYVARAAKAAYKSSKRRASVAPQVNTVLQLAQWLRTPAHRFGIENKPRFMISPHAPRLWVDAVKVGQLAGYPTEDGEGITVTEQMIDQMIENLHASPDPIPVDGAGVSEVHGTVDNTATEAAGWVFDARKEQGADGLAHMHLLLELRPDVMAKIKAGGFKFGSIAFVEDSIDRVSAKPTGAVLDSYAITNKPFVQGLQPHLVMSTPPAGYTNAASTAGSLLTTALSSVKPSADARRVRLSQPSEVLVSDAKFTFARINQVEKAILEAAGITGEIPTEELGERLLMKIVEMKAKAGITDPPPAAKGKGADLADDEDEDDKAALAARALQEGAGAVADQVMSMLMEAFQLPAEAPPETLLELLTANLDAIKAAVAGAPAADPNAEPGGAPVEPPALSPPPTLAAQPGPRVVALEAEVLKLRAEANAQKRIETEEFVTRAFDERGLNLDDKARTLMVDACLEHGREHLTNHILEGIKPKAPQGRVFSDHRPRRATVGATVDTEADPFLVRVNECVEELRPKHTGSDKALRREAFNLAQSRHPELVRRG